jgi:hypothetical protein
MDTYVDHPNWERRCQPYSCPVKYGYPNSKTCFNPYGKVSLEGCSDSSSFKEKTDVRTLEPSPDSSPKLCSEGLECIPFGYQPKRFNPGGLKFSTYDYPYHTAGGVPLFPPGMGWYKYQNTGRYYTWW